jgi:RNA polymerase sigma factor (sigma-70 family)
MSPSEPSNEALFAEAKVGNDLARGELLQRLARKSLKQVPGVVEAPAALVGETVEVASAKFSKFLTGLTKQTRSPSLSNLETWLADIALDVFLLSVSRSHTSKEAKEAALGQLLMRKVPLAMSALNGIEKHTPKIDPKDILQEAWWRAARDFDSFKGNLIQFESWLYNAAYHVFCSSCRYWETIKRQPGEPETLEEMLPRSSGPVTKLQRTELRKKILKRLHGLPPIHAEVVRLWYLDECSPEEIARRVDRTMPAVYVLRHRACKLLKQEFETEKSFVQTRPGDIDDG